MKRRLLQEEITYSAAKDKGINILHRLGYFEKQNQFIAELVGRTTWIKGVISHHLNIDPGKCDIADSANWFQGSFNLCIPVTIRDWSREQPGNRVLLRLPLPYKIGEAFRPGNADEKIRCEAGTYAWLQEKHPSIPIPRLYGFSLSSGESFTAIENLPFFARCYHYLRRQVFIWVGRFIWPQHAILSRYIRHSPTAPAGPGPGYILIEYIEPNQGRMLSDTWLQNSNNTALRATLFRSLARILLSLSHTPLPRIGSFIIDNNGLIILSNRPLTLEIQELENEYIPTNILRNYTYLTSDSYLTDIVSLHNNRLLYQPNAINDGSDYIQQVTTLTAMRVSIPLFFRQELRRGPFIFSLTDLHQSNIFVDQEWNITSLVDLEWGCSLPIEMVHPPYWLTSQSITTIDENKYKGVWTEFILILLQEDNTYLTELRLSTIMSKGWERGTFWYSLAIQSPTAIFHLFIDKIQGRLGHGKYSDDQYGLVMMYHWAFNTHDIFKRKVKEKEEYDKKLRDAFNVPEH
ncbi:hypothetical protein MauCBS54593_000244 [Microsporum audouinii]